MRWMADAILALHAVYVLFVVGGMVLICVGAACHWQWVRYFWFRILHLAAIVLVAIEAIVGVACPLTVLEDWLRSSEQASAGFVGRWVHRILFWDFPLWVFTSVYLLLALFALRAWWKWPPIRRARSSRMHLDIR